MEAFQALKGQKEKRDEIYMDYLTQNAIQKKFGNNENIDALMSLTPEGRIELLKSDYKTDFQMEREKEEDQEKGWLDYSLGERWNAVTTNSTEKAQEGMIIGGVAGGIIPGAGTGAGMGVGGATGLVYGALRGIVMPETTREYNTSQKQADNEEILNKKRKKLRRKNKIVLFTGVALIAGAFAFYKVALSSNLNRETLNTIKNMGIAISGLSISFTFAVLKKNYTNLNFHRLNYVGNMLNRNALKKAREEGKSANEVKLMPITLDTVEEYARKNL
jgi:hypothetical protein